MLIRVKHSDSVSLADQIAGQLRGLIANGSVVAGERLPSARELAESLEVNMHTVLRAYAQLQSEELIDLRRGRGAVVSANNPAAHADVAQLARDLLAAGRTFGLSTEAVVDLLRKVQT